MPEPALAAGSAVALSESAPGDIRERPSVAMTLVRTLDVDRSPSAGRGKFLSAASGLVMSGTHYLVVADDELQMGVFKTSGGDPGSLFRLLPGDLSAEKKARKKLKPDFESMTMLSAEVSGNAHGAVLVLGSGSTTHRDQAVVVPLDANGMPATGVRRVDFSPLYDTLRDRLPELNIEGQIVTGTTLRLFQRGNGAKSRNALVDLDLSRLLPALRTGQAVDRNAVVAIHPVELGTLGKIPLTFTDATLLPDGRTVFLAAAEDTTSTYEDGTIGGSAVGILNRENQVTVLRPLNKQIKAEGVAATLAADGSIHLLLVDDADDPAATGYLLKATLCGKPAQPGSVPDCS